MPGRDDGRLRQLQLTEYVRKSWYIQAQQVESYQPLDSLYCVTATYDLDGATVPFAFRGTVVTVYNYGNKGAVNGPNVNKNNMTLCARATNASDTSRLAVAPCFLPNLAAGRRLLGVGADASGEYEWAVVIGGNPTVAYADGCTTSETRDQQRRPLALLEEPGRLRRDDGRDARAAHRPEHLAVAAPHGAARRLQVRRRRAEVSAWCWWCVSGVDVIVCGVMWPCVMSFAYRELSRLSTR